MAYKDEKIVRVLLNETSNVEARCDGYQKELKEALAEIVQKERANLFQRTKILVEIEDIVDRVGTFIKLKEREQ